MSLLLHPLHHTDTVRAFQPLLHECAEDHRLVQERIDALSINSGARTGMNTIYTIKVEAVAKAIAELGAYQRNLKEQVVALLDEARTTEVGNMLREALGNNPAL